jgi:hypothetical protein
MILTSANKGKCRCILWSVIIQANVTCRGQPRTRVPDLLENENRKQKTKQSYTPWWRLGGEQYSSYSFDLGTRWGWVVSVTPLPRFVPGKGPPVPIVQEAGWAPEPVWTQRLENRGERHQIQHVDDLTSSCHGGYRRLTNTEPNVDSLDGH